MRPLGFDQVPIRLPYRLGPCRYVECGGCLVRVTEDGRLCTVFLGWPDPKDEHNLIRIVGTGFFVAHEGQGHLVTARHVAEILAEAPFGVRLTDRTGEARVITIDHANWHSQPDRSIDVAVTLFDWPDWTLTTALPSDEFVDDRRIRDWEIGPGDAAYVVGLFNLHFGKKKNLPVVHAGHIALMPSDEKIPVRDEKSPTGITEVEGYLVEAQALPGASGSPVTVRPTIRFLAEHTTDDLSPGSPAPKIAESLAFAESRDFLLGVWIGAWPGPPDKVMQNALGLSKDAWVPVGMGIVIPAQALMKVLRSENMSRERENFRTKEMASHAAVQMATAKTGVSTDTERANPAHKEDFTSLLGEAARTPPQDD